MELSNTTNNILLKACLFVHQAFGLCKKRLERDLPQNLNPDTRIYMSLGTEEFKRPQRFIKNIQEFNDYIVSQGATSYINIITWRSS